MRPRVQAPATVIDLGLDRDAPAHERRPPGRWWSPSARRRWALAGCLVLVLLTVVGATPPPPALILVDPAPPASTTGFALVGDELYVMTGGPAARLSAYHLPDARLLWSVPAFPADIVVAWRGGDIALVLTQRTRNDCCDVLAYDRADGELRWSRRGDVISVDAGDELVVLAAGASTQTVDIRSGRVLWEVDRSAVRRIPGAGYVLLTYPDGTAERRDVRTGAVRATGRIHEPGDQLFTQAIVDGQLVVGYRRDYQDITVTAYDGETLGLAWTRPGLQVDGVGRCGPMVCLHTAGGLQALDPRSGRVAWHRSGWSGPELGGRLLAVTSEPHGARVTGVVDPTTGRILLDLRSWQVHLGSDPATRLVLSRAAADARRTTVALADITRLTVQVIGVVPGRVIECQAGAANLACRTADGRFRLWAYRR